MKRIIVFLCCLMFLVVGYGQSIKIAEWTFESPGGYITSNPEFTNNNSIYLTRTDGSNIMSGAPTYTNVQGNYYFAAQNIDGEPDGTNPLPQYFSLDNINISGYSGLEFRVYLAESSLGGENWDANFFSDDFVRFRYDIDNTGTFSNLLWVEGAAGTFGNQEPRIDNNFDSTGEGTEITDNFTQYILPIAGTGGLLDIQIEISLDKQYEDIAFDNIEIWGIPTSGCSTTTIWNGSGWDNGVPNSFTNAIIDGNYTTVLNGSFEACSLIVNAGFTLSVDNNTYIEIENSITGDGNIDVDNQGSIVQNDDAGVFSLNGTATLFKLTDLKQNWYYYTYWSSPVENETIAGAFPDTPGDRRFLFNAANYLDTDNDDIDDDANDWEIASGASILTPGVGYTAASSPFGFYPGNDSADFIGNFNTGDIITPIAYNAASFHNWNFVGNPYPCALDFDAFYAANSTVIEGAAYFWSQSLPPDAGNSGNDALNFNQNDYALYTVGSGGTSSANGNIPDQYIPSAQGFFVNGLANGNVTFTNAMRTTGNNTDFYRIDNSIDKNRVWINLTSDNGVYNQILLAYVNGATSGYDGMAYDAPRNLSSGNAAILYSIIEGNPEKFAIQGKSPESLTNEEIILIGINNTIEVETHFNLSLANFQGDFFNNNIIYLRDNYLDIEHNLSDSDYSFSSDVGEFNDRFELRFSNTLSLNQLSTEPGQLILNYLENNTIQLSTGDKNPMVNLKVFDMLGRKLINTDFQSQSIINLDLNALSNGIMIVNITLSDGNILSKKIFNNY